MGSLLPVVAKTVDCLSEWGMFLHGFARIRWPKCRADFAQGKPQKKYSLHKVNGFAVLASHSPAGYRRGATPGSEATSSLTKK